MAERRQHGHRPQAQANKPEVILQRGVIVGRYLANQSISEISRELGLSRNTVMKWIRRYEEEGHVSTRPRTGRPRITTVEHDALLFDAAAQSPFKTSMTLTPELNLPCSARTTRTRLVDSGLASRVPARKPSLSTTHGRMVKPVLAHHGVEDWLGRVESYMRASLRRLILGRHFNTPLNLFSSILPYQMLQMPTGGGGP
ncbi:hypothetical protein Pcinc_004934 [Petrolisthes cinctipes]|uniref:Transposase n=1 Tax=Petrolisthes cinctipes TaxID=88211 RepID=A0AAE1L0L4_PETCI|nr:hypothetical protein Pcinc_004934 [Petrolisthes cinctipes]